MKKFNLVTAIICATLLSATCFAAAQKQTFDQIVAVVNDDVVTKSELNLALSTARAQISQESVPTPPEQILRKQVLDQLINKKLQLQIAKQVGIDVTDDDLNKAIQQVATQNNITVATLYERLKQEGMSLTDYRNEIRDQLTMQRLQQQEVVNHITITPQEVDNFLKSNAWKTNTAKEYRIDDILILTSDAPSPDEIRAARTRAQMVLNKLKNGLSFTSVAQADSSGARALQGGDLGWRKLPEIPSAFAEQISRMQKNEIAGPIQTPNGFHIIKLSDTRALSSQQAITERKQIEELLLQRKFEEAMQNWVSRLRSQSFIETKTLA
jgi:peptidyl-prolyl cis-trans isomerase SurA